MADSHREVSGALHESLDWEDGAQHRYLSTACLHAVFDEKLHDQCRLTCKYCPSRCCCPCHSR